ncbi:MAG: chaperone modulator CbpM [Agriterribacter sp.]
MQATPELITQDECCIQYNIELSFIQSLNEYGLIEIITVEEKPFLHTAQLSELEKFIRLHYDLNINMEGIDVIANLLKKVQTLQNEVGHLKNRLQVYGSSDHSL